MKKLLLLLPLLFTQPASAEVVNLECKLTRLSDNAVLTWLITFDESTQMVTRHYVEQGAVERYKIAIITADAITFSGAAGSYFRFDHAIDRNTGIITQAMDSDSAIGLQVMKKTGQVPGAIKLRGPCKKAAPAPERAF